MSLLFAVGGRPSASHIERLLTSAAHVSPRVQVAHSPEDSEGWLELLANGLTFEVTGLSPAGPGLAPRMEHQFGLSLDAAKFDFEAITITPGVHIAGGGGMTPVVRSIAAVAAGIAADLPVKAVCWHPIGSWMEPAYFRRIVASWLSGGAFPALGFTAVRVTEVGVVESTGLAFFAGQDVRVEPAAGEAHAETIKRAVRVIDYITRHGALDALTELEGPDGEPVLVEPSRNGRQVRVWRGV